MINNVEDILIQANEIVDKEAEIEFYKKQTRKKENYNLGNIFKIENNSY